MGRVKITDTEVYKNYCLIGFIDAETGNVVSAEAIDGCFTPKDREWLRSYMRKYLTVGFNSKGFDLPIIYAAIMGFSTRRIKEVADAIIIDGLKPWDIEDEYGIKVPTGIDHVDLIEVAPGKASLKIYNGRMHGKRMQDLPIEPDKVLTDEEIEETYDYWKNDLDATVLLWKSLKKQIDLRAEMSREHGVDLRSKSDAQVAEAVIKAGLTKLLGSAPKKPEFKGGQRYRYNIPDFIRFRRKELNDILDDIEDSWFKMSPGGKMLMPQALTDAKIKIGNSVYRMGIGGLHSSEETISHVATDDVHLFDRDVASYYPFIIINLGLFPAHLGKAFLRVYKTIVFKRLDAKAKMKAIEEEIADLEKVMKERNGPSPLMEEKLAELKDDLAKWKVATEGLKITINGSFGKLGSKYSILFAPQLLIQTTITGQLSLLMLIEWMEDAGIECVSGNTDGVIMKVRKDQKDDYLRLIKKWEKVTGFETEETEYSAVYSRDVNNYIAVKKKDGKAKRKGAYATSGLEEKKNPTNEICSDAVVEFITKGTPISKTIKECKDIRKFLTVRTVKGGATKDGEYLGKAVRFYHSTATTTAIHYKTANVKGNHNKVPKSDGAMPCMTLPESMPTDVDFSFYIREAREILKEIAFEQDVIGTPPKRTRKKQPETEDA